jgi:hypothetical protein
MTEKNYKYTTRLYNPAVLIISIAYATIFSIFTIHDSQFTIHKSLDNAFMLSTNYYLLITFYYV